jgi:1-acyl-sn-glycerol-3-phosphate acyltransferase
LLQDGWHATGDRAYLAGGDIHLTGRVKDLIIRGGRNIYPYEVEQALGEMKGVRKGCVVAFAAPDAELGSERLVILAESKERDPVRRAQLTRELRERATDVLGMPPDELALVPPRSVLKTSSGKLRRGATRDRYLTGRLTAESRGPAEQLIRAAMSGLRARLRDVPASLYAAYAWAIFALIALPIWLGITVTPSVSTRWTLARVGVRLLRRLTGMRLIVSGAVHLPPRGQPFVLAANHQSYLDGLLLAEALGRPIGFVAKAELGTQPLVAGLLRRMGVRFVERFDPRAGAAQSTHLVEALRDGQTLAFFPEGTFRDRPGLLPFRMGAFLAAAQARVPLVPVALRGTRALMPGDSFRPRPGCAEVVIGPPISPKADDWETAIRLRDEARTWIAERAAE